MINLRPEILILGERLLEKGPEGLSRKPRSTLKRWPCVERRLMSGRGTVQFTKILQGHVHGLGNGPYGVVLASDAGGTVLRPFLPSEVTFTHNRQVQTSELLTEESITRSLPVKRTMISFHVFQFSPSNRRLHAFPESRQTLHAACHARLASQVDDNVSALSSMELRRASASMGLCEYG